jgi:transposase-like protein
MENKAMPEPTSLQEAILYFSNPDNCIDYIAIRRWPNGKVICPGCGSEKVSQFNAKRRTWKCGSHHPKREFSIKVGTIYEDSPIPLDKWLMATWMLANCKNGVSSYEIAKAIKVSQKAAWFMDHRIRLAMQDEFFGSKLGGEVEVDETFIGGKARNMHKSKRLRMKVREDNWGKTIVMGMLQRGGHVRATVVPDRKKQAIHSTIAETIEAGTQLYTDDHTGYMDMSPEFVHNVINHAKRYVDGRVHTNGIENFWSCLKRGLNGTYVSVEPFHLFRYLDEQMFRYNNRKNMNDADRFSLAVSQIVGKRITFAQLTGKPN